MRAAALADLARKDLRRSARTFGVAVLGIAVGIATLAFFLGLGAGMRDVVLGRIFPIDRIEVAPGESSAGAMLPMLGLGHAPGIEPAQIRALRATSGVRAVYPKLRFLFPSSGRGGHELLGRDIGTGELVGDGIEASLVQPDLRPGVAFVDPFPRASHAPCSVQTDCAIAGEMCDLPLASDGHPLTAGQCSPPIPAVVSPYLVEVFNGAIAPAHHLPALGSLLVRSAEGFILEWDLGRAGLGSSRIGQQRRVHVRIVGVSPRAVDLGITVPLDVARRLDREFAGAGSEDRYTSAVVQLVRPSSTGPVTSAVRAMGLEVRTSGAEQMGLLVAIITAILSLTSVIVVVVASLNIAHVFFSLIAERRGEIGLMRALGATRGDVRALVFVQAAALGLVSSLLGLLLARGAALGWNHLAATRLPAFPFKPDNWFVFDAPSQLAVVAFGVVACVLAAAAPATRAARIEPAAALAGGV